MSGGAFDYKQYHIDEIVDHIARIMHALDSGDLGEEDRYSGPSQWEKSLVHESKEEVKEEFRKAIKALQVAACYAQRIDWFLSGDDGEDSFLKRLKEELELIHG